MEERVFFSEFRILKSPRGQQALVPLDTPEALEVCGHLAEGIILNDSITIPITGPALEIVALIRWLGDKGFRELLDEGVLKFSFCPGILSYISRENKKALGLKAEPGLNWLIGTDPSWESIIGAVNLALIEQLNFHISKARRWGIIIEKNTVILPVKEIREKVEKSFYNLAFPILESDGVKEIDDLKKLDNVQDNHLIQKLINITKANFDLSCSSVLNCSEIYGNELTWEITQPRGIEKDSKYNLSKILELEGIPDIHSLIVNGWPAFEVVKTRKDKHCIEFRNWLKTMPNETDFDIAKAYCQIFKRNKSDNLMTKIIRIGIVNLLGIPSSIVGIPISIIDTLWGDKLINGWNPRIFIAKHFKYSDKN